MMCTIIDAASIVQRSVRKSAQHIPQPNHPLGALGHITLCWKITRKSMYVCTYIRRSDNLGQHPKRIAKSMSGLLGYATTTTTTTTCSTSLNNTKHNLASSKTLLALCALVCPANKSMCTQIIGGYFSRCRACGVHARVRFTRPSCTISGMQPPSSSST